MSTCTCPSCGTTFLHSENLCTKADDPVSIMRDMYNKHKIEPELEFKSIDPVSIIKDRFDEFNVTPKIEVNYEPENLYKDYFPKKNSGLIQVGSSKYRSDEYNIGYTHGYLDCIEDVMAGEPINPLVQHNARVLIDSGDSYLRWKNQNKPVQFWNNF